MHVILSGAQRAQSKDLGFAELATLDPSTPLRSAQDDKHEFFASAEW